MKEIMFLPLIISLVIQSTICQIKETQRPIWIEFTETIEPKDAKKLRILLSEVEMGETKQFNGFTICLSGKFQDQLRLEKSPYIYKEIPVSQFLLFIRELELSK